jgi:hypothetical protein
MVSEQCVKITASVLLYKSPSETLNMLEKA